MSDETTSPWDLDVGAVRAAFARPNEHFESAAFVHAQVRDRLLERLDWVKLSPDLILDVGTGLGQGATALAERFPGARLLAVDVAVPMLERANLRFGPDGPRCLGAEGTRLPLPSSSVDLLFANLLVPWVADVTRLFAEWRRVLRPSGLLTFTSLGPDTLYELAQAWACVDDGPHTHGFFDMHDIGDVLVSSGLAEPVLDVEHLRITYPNVESLARELKACGAQNATQGRRRTLTGPGRWRDMVKAYPQGAAANRIEATVEIIFAQAWGAAEDRGPRADPRVTAIPVADVKRRRR